MVSDKFKEHLETVLVSRYLKVLIEQETPEYYMYKARAAHYVPEDYIFKCLEVLNESNDVYGYIMLYHFLKYQRIVLSSNDPQSHF